MRYQAKVTGRVDVPQNGLLVVDHQRLSEVAFSERELAKFTAIGSRFDRCRFDKMRIEDASFGSGREASEYVDCDFDGLQFLHGAGAARFVNCSFRNTKIRNWIGNRTELIDCAFTGEIRKAIFSGTVPRQFRADLRRERNEFRNNDFSQADLIDVTFCAGIDLTQQRLPGGPQYLYLPHPALVLERAQAVILTWPESEDRKTAAAITSSLSQSLADGQQQLFIRPKDWTGYGGLTAEGANKLFAILRVEKGSETEK